MPSAVSGRRLLHVGLEVKPIIRAACVFFAKVDSAVRMVGVSTVEARHIIAVLKKCGMEL